MSKKQGQHARRDPETLSAEIVQRDGEGVAAYAVRMLEMDRREKQRRGMPVISEKSFVRKCGKLRREMERMQGTLRKGNAPPINIVDPAFVEHMRKISERREADFQKGPMHLMSSLFATADHIRRDPEYKATLQSTPVDRLQAHMVKPWKGRAGNVARTAIRKQTKLSKKERAIELRRQGHTEIEIATTIKCTERTVRRYLTGR